MPNLDGTGPIGRGAMTGKGCGGCRTDMTSRPQQERGISSCGARYRQSADKGQQGDIFVKRNST